MRTAPAQAPPHIEPSEAQAVRTPCGEPTTALQVPTLPGTSQASHWPEQLVSQQTPSTQWPVVHCESLEHEPPCGRSATHTPPEQKFPAVQSASTEQFPAQAVGPHR